MREKKRRKIQRKINRQQGNEKTKNINMMIMNNSRDENNEY